MRSRIRGSGTRPLGGSAVRGRGGRGARGVSLDRGPQDCGIGPRNPLKLSATRCGGPQLGVDPHRAGLRLCHTGQVYSPRGEYASTAGGVSRGFSPAGRVRNRPGRGDRARGDPPPSVSAGLVRGWSVLDPDLGGRDYADSDRVTIRSGDQLAGRGQDAGVDRGERGLGGRPRGSGGGRFPLTGGGHGGEDKARACTRGPIRARIVA